jgi:hypothetical protein
LSLISKAQGVRAGLKVDARGWEWRAGPGLRL